MVSHGNDGEVEMREHWERQDNLLRYVLLAIFILVPAVNFGVPAFLESQDRFSDDPQTRVNAAGYAFAIWGLIFTGMLAFSGALLLFPWKNSVHLRRAKISLTIAGIASILFVPISIYGDQLLGWLDIMLHLFPLIYTHVCLRRHAAAYPSSNAARWSLIGPSMYFAWICAASVISTALLGQQLGIELGDTVATTIAVAVLSFLAIVAIGLTLARDPVYGATVAWALLAVGVEQASFPIVRATAWGMAGLVIAVVVYQLTRRQVFYAIQPESDQGLRPEN